MLKRIFMFTITAVFIAGIAYAAPVDLPKTGQTTCYDTSGAVIDCANTGQDGDLQKGIAWPSPRFTGDATGKCITDNLTGLMWMQTPDITFRTWQEALDYANNLTLCGYSDWRLPDVNELEGLAANAGVPNSVAWLNTQGFSNVHTEYYWSSTTYAGNTTFAWTINMDDGDVFLDEKAYPYFALPVRANPIFPK